MDALDKIRKIFLYLLDEDKDVRDKLKEVVSDTGEIREGKPSVGQEGKSGRKEPNVSLEELAKTKAKLEDALRQKEESERLCEELRRELRAQQEEQERERNAWEAERGKMQEAQNAAQDEARRWEREAEKKEDELRAALSDKEKWQAKHDQAKQDLKKAQARIADQEAALEARFPRGWELFRQYPRISAATREALTRVFVHAEDFSSFICCGAQSDALEEIWEIMETCWEKKQDSDLRILREIFAYCMELANLSRRNKIFAMLEAKPGDNYDRRVHLLELSSKKQGMIRQVCVQGFYNVNTGKVIKQALVILE